MIEPQAMLGMLSPNPALAQIAKEVEVATTLMIDEAK